MLINENQYFKKYSLGQIEQDDDELFCLQQQDSIADKMEYEDEQLLPVHPF